MNHSAARAAFAELLKFTVLVLLNLLQAQSIRESSRPVPGGGYRGKSWGRVLGWDRDKGCGVLWSGQDGGILISE